MEWLILGGAYIRWEFCVTKPIGLASSSKVNFKKNMSHRIVFALFYFVFGGNFQVYKPPGAYFRRGDLTKGFLSYDFGGLIFGGAYTWRGLFSEFYGILIEHANDVSKLTVQCSAVFLLFKVWKKPAKNCPIFLSALTF